MNTPLTMLVILDGVGINKQEKGNALLLANTPNFDRMLNDYPNAILYTSGEYVGLPKGQMGNSEVGHMNIGAGRIIYQEMTRISKSIENKEFFQNNAFIEAINNCKRNNTKLHLLGLLSDGGVHSLNTHLYALLDLCKQEKFYDVIIHPFLDGRDTPPTSGINYIKDLLRKIEQIGFGKIGTIMGRFYAMDRDNRYERIQVAYDALVLGIGEINNDPILALNNSYQENVTDEFVKPIIINKSLIEENDSIIFFNYRHDRARELTRCFTDENYNNIKRNFFPVTYVCMTEYDVTIPNVLVAFPPIKIENTYGEVISKNGLRQLRIAETEKYAHVTFFFNGGEEKEFPGERRILIPSPKVKTYDLEPEMSAYLITDEVLKVIKNHEVDTIILNYANGDMVGHTGNLDASIKACEVLDECLGKLEQAILEVDGNMLIIADHGNCEMMIDYETNMPHTAHTTNPVHSILISKDDYELKDGILADVAPTLLELQNILKPSEMTGTSLLQKK